MRNRGVDLNITDALQLPKVVQLGKNLYAAAFAVMKLLPAAFILDRARDAGLIQPGSTIIETTSGTFGLALAMLCAVRRYRLILVSDPVVDEALKSRLEGLGAVVDIVRAPSRVGGFQGARLERLAELRAEHSSHFWPSQYDNPHNPGAYAPFGELLTESLGKIDCLVGTVGSAGSMCGTSFYLRVLYPNLKAVGVDTHGSVLFGQRDQKRLLRGLGNSLMPKNLTHSVFDEVHWVSAAEAFLATRVLHAKHALYMGGTSGAAYLAADWWARQHPDSKVVVLLPDEGYRYQQTVYDDGWLRANKAYMSKLPASPRLVQSPSEAGPEWCHMAWDRRTYEQVVGASFQSEQ
jgi:cysteine synthase